MKGPIHQAKVLHNPDAQYVFWTDFFLDRNHLVAAGCNHPINGGNAQLFSADEVGSALQALKSKTPGEDGLRVDLFKKFGSDRLHEELARLFNDVAGRAQPLPEWMRSGIGRLIHKKGPRNDPSNYRLIVLAPVLAKVYENYEAES